MDRPDLKTCKTNREMILVMSEYMFGCLEGIDKSMNDIKVVNIGQDKLLQQHEKMIKKNAKDIHTGRIILRIAGVLFTGLTVIIGLVIRVISMGGK